MKRLLLLAVLCLPLAAQTAINDTLYLQGATPWTGQITVSWPAFTSCTGTPIARGSRVSPVNAGVVAISLWASDCASPSFAYSATYRTMGGANHGQSWTETWAVPSSPSIVTLRGVRQSSTLKFFPSQLIAAGLADGSYCIDVASEAATGLVACGSAWADITGKPSTFTPSAHAGSHASAGSDPVTVAQSQVTGLVSALAGKAPTTASTTVNGQPCALGGSCSIPVGTTLPGVSSDGSNGITIEGAIKAGDGTTPTAIDIVCVNIAGLPLSGIPTGRHMLVCDGTNGADSTVGGGSNKHWVYWTGSAWVSEDSTGPQGPAGTNGTNSVVAATSPVTYNGGTQTVACPTCTITIASGQTALGTSAISSGACATVVTVSASGVATTDVISANFASDPTGITGYLPSTSGMLLVYPYPTANAVNFKVCNPTLNSITPGAASVNWGVRR